MISLLYRAADAVRRRKFAGDPGRLGEDAAHRFLRSKGCTIVARNYRRRAGAGEIDLVAWHGPRLVFVEVKTRTSADFGAPSDAVDYEKREALQHTAREYARRANIDWKLVRFDIVSILLGDSTRIDWLQDAFR